MRAWVSVMCVCALSASAGAEMARGPSLDKPAPRHRPPPPPQPSPVADVTAHAQDLVGAWTCGGEAMVVTLDLDSAWVVIRTRARTTYRTYDPVAKEWTQVTMTADGALTTTTSPGEDKGVWTFTGASVREREQRTADGLRLRREELRGDAWVGTYEATCARGRS